MKYVLLSGQSRDPAPKSINIPRAFMRTRRPAVLLLAAALLAVPACDSNDEKTDIQGLWLVPGIDVIYYHIERSKITIYDYMGDEFDEGPDCYIITELDIVRRDGTNVTVSSPDFPGIQIVLDMERDGQTLTVTSSGDTETWEKSSLSVSTFEANECTGAELSGKEAAGARGPKAWLPIG
jgi:hypothetical protein